MLFNGCRSDQREVCPTVLFVITYIFRIHVCFFMAVGKPLNISWKSILGSWISTNNFWTTSSCTNVAFATKFMYKCEVALYNRLVVYCVFDV